MFNELSVKQRGQQLHWVYHYCQIKTTYIKRGLSGWLKVISYILNKAYVFLNLKNVFFTAFMGLSILTVTKHISSHVNIQWKQEKENP